MIFPIFSVRLQTDEYTFIYTRMRLHIHSKSEWHSIYKMSVYTFALRVDPSAPNLYLDHLEICT